MAQEMDNDLFMCGGLFSDNEEEESTESPTCQRINSSFHQYNFDDNSNQYSDDERQRTHEEQSQFDMESEGLGSIQYNFAITDFENPENPRKDFESPLKPMKDLENPQKPRKEFEFENQEKTRKNFKNHEELRKNEEDYVEISSHEYSDSRTFRWLSQANIPSAPMLESPTTLPDLTVYEPPEWLKDSATANCLICWAAFKAVTRRRHHCRMCGGIFCGKCSNKKCLLPPHFRIREPQRVCNWCYDYLSQFQELLIKSHSNASKSATHDITDWTCLRSWINMPLAITMEEEIYKATNVLRSYSEMGKLKPEKSIPGNLLKRAKGLAILTVAKAGVMVTYKFGTGLVIARKSDGSWSAPSAVSATGIGWGVQTGGELTDFVIVLENENAIKAFCNRVHLSVGAGVSAAAGLFGRATEAGISAGFGGVSACYTYSSSKGAFVGMSLEGNLVTTRRDVNVCFYGNPKIETTDILLGDVPHPRAAGLLYKALSNLFEGLKLQR